jgi:hypothetical protein
MLTRAVALLLLLAAAGCGSDDASSAPDMHASADLFQYICLAIACVDSCPGGNSGLGSYCVINRPSDQYGLCTDGPSTCGVRLTGDCSFRTQCLDANTLGMLFTPIDGGCGIERYHCNHGCVDPRADGGAGPEAHCNP